MEKATNIDILVFVIAAIFMLLWIFYLIRCILKDRAIARRNRRLYEFAKNIALLSARIDEQAGELEEARFEICRQKAALNPAESSDGTAADPDLSGTDHEAALRKLNAKISATGLYKNPKASREELMQLASTDKKGLESIIAAAGHKGSDINGYLSSFRMREAENLLRDDIRKAAQNEEGFVARAPQEIAEAAGFSSARTMDKAVQTTYGFSLEELIRIIRKEK